VSGLYDTIDINEERPIRKTRRIASPEEVAVFVAVFVSEGIEKSGVERVWVGFGVRDVEVGTVDVCVSSVGGGK
jgi:hypothetical protein